MYTPNRPWWPSGLRCPYSQIPVERRCCFGLRFKFRLGHDTIFIYKMDPLPTVYFPKYSQLKLLPHHDSQWVPSNSRFWVPQRGGSAPFWVAQQGLKVEDKMAYKKGIHLSVFSDLPLCFKLPRKIVICSF